MQKALQWEVYIIQTTKGMLYTGITNDMDRRFADHQSCSKEGANKKTSRKGAQFFYFSKPSHIVFREAHPDRSAATKREIEIKKMSRNQKLALIEKQPITSRKTVEKPV